MLYSAVDISGSHGSSENEKVYRGARTVSLVGMRTGRGPTDFVFMPAYEAIPDKDMSKALKPKSVVQILRDQFEEDFLAAAQYYAQRNPNDFHVYDELKDSRNPKVLSTTLIDTAIPAGQETSQVQIDLLQEAIVESEDEENIKARQRTRVYLYMRYYLDLLPCHRSGTSPIMSVLPPQEIKEAASKDPKGTPRLKYIMEYGKGSLFASEYLIPLISNEDYEAEAHKMLEKYYPEALGDAMPVDGEELAHRMGLPVKKVYLRPEDKDTMGIIFFGVDTLEIWDKKKQSYVKIKVKPGTIIVNLAGCKNNQEINGTIFHECIHFYFHRIFYFLQSLARPTLCYHAHKRREKKQTGYKRKSPVEWTELQAQKMPAYLMLPAETTSAVLSDFFAERGGRRTVDNIRDAVYHLADTFHVSLTMAKVRMIELGYPEAQGVLNYENGRKLPDYSCEKWENNRTYTITFSEAADLAASNKEFSKRLETGRYFYVDGHFCLNSPKYLGWTKAGKIYMTSYARNHVEECCLVFQIHGRYTNARYYGNHAQSAKKEPVTDKYLNRYDYQNAIQTVGTEKAVEGFVSENDRWYELEKDLPDSFYDAVNAVLDAKGISQMELAFRLDKERKSVYNFSLKESPETRHVVAICVALKLPYFISMKLLEIAGRSLRIRLKEERLFRMMLVNAESMTLEDCNAVLEHENLKPLI